MAQLLSVWRSHLPGVRGEVLVSRVLGVGETHGGGGGQGFPFTVPSVQKTPGLLQMFQQVCSMNDHTS